MVYVMDRGFRDSLQVLEDLGIKAQMPSFLKKGDEDANSFQLVSKVSNSETKKYTAAIYYNFNTQQLFPTFINKILFNFFKKTSKSLGMLFFLSSVLLLFSLLKRTCFNCR